MNRIALAIRSATTLTSSPLRIASCPRALGTARTRYVLAAPTSLQRRCYAAWTSPSHSKPTTRPQDTNIKKPTGPRSSKSPLDPFPPNPFPTNNSQTKSSDSSSTSQNKFNANLKPSAFFGEDSPYDDDFLNFNTDFKYGDLSRGAGEPLPAPAQPKLRLVPRLGRTIQVGKGMDVGRAIKVLNQQCQVNRVRQDFQYQRYHERAGMKRKRLKMERWRRRFKKGFKAACKRVTELRLQGW